jgi:hypothetical protein
MRLDEARGFVMQALRMGGWNQLGELFRLVGECKARAQGINPGIQQSYMGGRQFLERGDETLLNEVIWSLILERILVPGINDSNPNLPFLRLTEYGERCVAEERILPHDPDGYLREFQIVVPNAHPTIVEYLTESLQCYIHGLNRAAAVMLGGASEQAVLLLIESYTNSICDATLQQQFKSQSEKAPSIFRKFEHFERQLSTVRQHMPRTLTDNLDSLLRGVFDLIRSSRNDAGHPASGTQVSRDAVYSHLRLFVPYCERIYGLIEWFSANAA